MGRGSLGEVLDGSEDLQGGLGRVDGPSGRFGMGRWTHEEFKIGWGGPSKRPVMGRGTLGEVWDGSATLGEVWDGSGDPRGGPGQVGEPSQSS